MPCSWPFPSSRKNSPAWVPPVTSISSTTPARTSASIACETIGRSKTGSRCLFVIRVSGCSREPVPPARMTPFIARDRSRLTAGGPQRRPPPLLERRLGNPNDPRQRARQPPVVAAEERHQRGHEQRAHDRGVDEDRYREADPELLQADDSTGHEAGERRHHHDRGST